MRTIGLDSQKIDVKYVSDVESFIHDNNITIVGCVDELTPFQFLTYCLNWNGLIGYSENIVELMEQLGWELKQVPVVEKIISDEDRPKLIELLVDQQADMLMDCKHNELVCDLLEVHEQNLQKYSDAELLAEVGMDDDPVDQLDLDDELTALWAKYRRPKPLKEQPNG